MRILALVTIAFLVVGHHVQAATLKHEYTFDNATVQDNVGGLNGSLFGGATISGGVLQLDGIDDYAELSGQAIATGGADFSVVIRAQAFVPLAGNFVELISQGFSGAPGFYLGHDPNGVIRITDNFGFTGLTFPNDGAYHTYVLTSGDQFGTQLYIDGVNVFSGAELDVGGASGSNTRFGKQFSPFSENLHGNIDYIGVFDGELTDGVVPSAVPLPAAIPLMGTAFGLMGLIGLRRRTRA